MERGASRLRRRWRLRGRPGGRKAVEGRQSSKHSMLDGSLTQTLRLKGDIDRAIEAVVVLTLMILKCRYRAIEAVVVLTLILKFPSRVRVHST